MILSFLHRWDTSATVSKPIEMVAKSRAALFNSNVSSFIFTNTVKPRYNGFEGTKYIHPLLPKSVIANRESKRKICQGTEAKFAIIRFFTILGCVIARFYCSHKT